MAQSKLVRSALRHKKPTSGKFVPLIKIQSDTIYTQREGLEVLKKISNGELIILAFQQSQTEIPFKMFQCYELNNVGNEAGIWISQNYIEDEEYGFRLIGLVGNSKTTEDLMRVHIFNSILSSVVIINVYPGYSDYKFLKAVEGRVTYSKHQSENYKLREQLANLVILERGKMKDSTLINDSSRINSIERQQGLPGLQTIYRSASFFEFIADSELKFNKELLQQFQNVIIQLHLSKQRQIKKLHYGPVLAEFIPQMVKEYNQKYSFNYTNCLDRIYIDEGYEAYMEALQVYNEGLRGKFNSNQPIQNPEEQLRDFREDALREYKHRTRDMEYLTQLNNTIDDKEERIMSINDRMWHDKNIQILRKESKNLLRYAENRQQTNFDVKRQTERIVNVYNSRAGGRTKQQDLNGFLSKLNETLGQDNYDKNVRISKLERENKRLEDRLKKLEKKGCCSKCEIM